MYWSRKNNSQDKPQGVRKSRTQKKHGGEKDWRYGEQRGRADDCHGFEELNVRIEKKQEAELVKMKRMENLTTPPTEGGVLISKGPKQLVIRWKFGKEFKTENECELGR